jgi:hypothetical protein
MDLPLVPIELKRMTDAMAQLGYKQILPKLTRNPTKRDFVSMLTNQLKNTPSQSGGMLVFYFTGHGHDDHDRHYLLLSDSNPDDLDGTALPVEELARLLIKKRRFDQTLIILDVCYAGRGNDDITAVFQRLKSSFSTYQGSGAFLFASARSWEQASQCAFSEAFAQVVLNEDGQWGGKTQQFLYPDAIVGAVNSLLPKPSQQAVLTALDVTDHCRLFPNRNYDATIPAGLDLESQRSRDFAEHWIPRAHGTQLASSTSYFSGREQALREIVAWLVSKHPLDTLRVVTGAPGAGKSAILARVVTLSEPEYRKTLKPADLIGLPQDTLPPAGIVDIAVHARGKTLGQVVEIIADKIGLRDPASQPAERVVLAIRRGRKRLVIVLDALDESVGPGDIVSALLSKLPDIRRIRLLVGSRHIGSKRSRLVVPGLGQVNDTIDLDLPKYNDPADIENYARSRLLSAHEPWVKTPYRDKPDIAETVARAIAAKAGSNYLYARIVCSSAMSADDVVNVDDRNWHTRLPNDVEAAFDRFLERLDELREVGFNKGIATALLTPLAFSEGEGLPRGNVWTSLANSIFSKSYTDKTDLANLFDYAAAYVVESSENGRSVYRLYHEAFADYLRKKAPRDTYDRVSKALLRMVPDLPGQVGKYWEIADPHIRAHLPSYLSKAGLREELDKLMLDVRYLVCADPDRLHRVLSEVCSEKAREAAEIYWKAYMAMTTDRLIATLTERAQNVLRSRFRLDARWSGTWSPRSYNEVGAELRISPRLVRFTEAQALRELRYTGRTGYQLQATPALLADRVIPASYLEGAARSAGNDAFADRVAEMSQSPTAFLDEPSIGK